MATNPLVGDFSEFIDKLNTASPSTIPVALLSCKYKGGIKRYMKGIKEMVVTNCKLTQVLGLSESKRI